MTQNEIIIRGARAHNLKNINVTIPKDKLVVIAGLSGSGKSSLAFDTLYAEGQRRYVESLSSYARQFLGQMDKPDVDSIEGLSPAISISQKTTSRNPRSTVGTVTEINDYMRLLWSRVGTSICPNDGHQITRQSPEQIVDQVMKLPLRSKLQILAPIVQNKRGQHIDILKKIQREGFVRIVVDGEMHEIGDKLTLDKDKKHSIAVVVDRIIMKEGIRSRLFDSIETALKLANGYVSVDVIGNETLQFSEKLTCPYCGFAIKELEPNLFSFNDPAGACPACGGLGEKIEVDESLVIPDSTKSLNEGAIVPWSSTNSKYYFSLLDQFCHAKRINMDKPFNKLTERQQNLILNGDHTKKIKFNLKSDFGKSRSIEMEFEGVLPNIERRFNDTKSRFNRESLRKYMTTQICKVCHGYRLNPQALAVKINGKSISEVLAMSIEDILKFIESLSFKSQDEKIARPILKEIHDRLKFLKNVGLDYLTLSRPARSLSGGEAQRIRLATQIGSNLSGVIYVLDEPSIGLHQRDNDRLIASLKMMRDLGNTLVVVEHDEDTMRAADYLIDIGPGAGANGGRIMAAGTPEEVMHNKNSLTGQYLAGKKYIPTPLHRRQGNGKHLVLYGAAENNLNNLTVDFPLGKFIAVTGVSGSGKSTLVNQILERILAQKINHNNTEKPGKYEKITGVENIDKVINIDQSPIGRTPRSNPATYTGVFDDIRRLFAQTNAAKMRGYNLGHFSFNKKGGRCETCKGDGVIKIEMNFLPDVYVTCDVCHGTRFNSETLEVEYKGKNIAEVLNMTVEEALKFFDAIPKIKDKLQTIVDVGLGYVQLGQAATTLSGGEAQRMKLAAELHKKATGKTFYILDEPTTGLHSDDIKRLLQVLQRLVDKGNTVLVIEHNLDVVKNADYLIDLGPEGGAAGGQIIATGTPEEVAQNPHSYTGKYLKPILAVKH